MVKERGGNVLVTCPESLRRLLARCPGIDRLIVERAWPAFDVQAPLLSVPGILGTTLATIPANVPYLYSDSERAEHWRGELSKLAGFKIGIAWQGNPRHKNDRNRSFPLLQFAPLAAIEGVQLFSLQKGAGREQLEAAASRFRLTDLGSKLDDFLETAAVVKNLDLIITADTALAHLAGALGAPVWVAIPFVPDWRWLLNRDDSPWYPTLRLFRQRQRRNWDEVFARMADELTKWRANCSRPR
jgi:ADP-heptose:LPS heptosyltransferase